MLRLRTFAASVAALLLSGAAARAEPVKDATIAVAGVESRGQAGEESAAEMGDALTAQLVKDGKLRVVERQQIAKVMKEQALSQSGAMSDEVQIKLAQLVGARFIALGAVQKSGQGLTLSLRAIDSSTAQVAFADTQKVGGEAQLEDGARALAQRLEARLLGGAVAQGGAAVGDFDPGQVKDSARALARSLAMRFPKIQGRIVDSLPDGTATCSFGQMKPFEGQFFEISGRDEVTESVKAKGYFLIKTINSNGCSGKIKRDGPGEVVAGDSLASVPLKISVDPLETGAGADAALGKVLADELKSALKSSAQFKVVDSPQLTAVGRVAGGRGHRTVELQVMDKSGNVVQQLEQPASF